MNESFVQVAADGPGKQIDTSTVTNPATGATQHRQVVSVGDPNNAGGVGGVVNGAQVVDEMAYAEGEFQEDILKMILIELRVLNLMIASEFRVRDSLEGMRADPTINTI